MPTNPENQSNGESSPREVHSTARRKVVFSRERENAAPATQSSFPETTPPITASPEEDGAEYYQSDPSETEAITGPPDEPPQPASIDPGDKVQFEIVAPPHIPRRVQLIRQVEADKPKGKGSKLRQLLEELADEEDETGLIEGQPAKVLQAKRLPRTGTTPEGNPLAFRPRPEQPPEMAGLAGDGIIYTPPRTAQYSTSSILLALVCILLLGLVVYLWLGRPHGYKIATSEEQAAAAARLPIPPNVSDHALDLVEKALAAEKSREFKKAAGLYQQARNEKLVLPGLNYQSASLALEAGDYDAAFSFVTRCIEANEDLPQCLYLRASAVALDGDFAAASENFAQAVRITPFSVRNYFFLAECLRRKGNFVAALEQFKQALLRRPTRAEAELIVFRMNLARIEVNNDNEIQKQITEHLAAKTPSGDTLLLATAAELNHGNYPAAAEYLQRCLSALPRPLLDSRLNDYFFRSHLQQSQMAAVLNIAKMPGPTGLLGATSAAFTRPALVNLADRSLAEADPAGWP